MIYEKNNMSCLSLVLLIFFGFILISFVYSIIMQTAWSEQSATIIGSIISGLMTIAAGYLAFRETRKTNEITNNTQAQLLLIERIKAVNLVRSDVVDVYKAINDIYEGSFDGYNTFKKLIANPDPAVPVVLQAYGYFNDNFPTGFDLKGKLADSLVILPDEAIEELRKLTKILMDVRATCKTDVIDATGLVDPMNYIEAFRPVFVSENGEASPIEIASSNCQKTIGYFIDLTDEYRRNYKKIVGQFIDV